MYITSILAQSPNQESSFNLTTITVATTTSVVILLVVMILFIVMVALIYRFQTNKQTSSTVGPGNIHCE